jgi:predicted amidophosphoribosyltransferase
MFCDRCGKELEAASRFCNSCGKPVGAPIPGTAGE